MAENTKIEWADHTFNPWIGCTKVSPACDNCYAEAMMGHRYGRVNWGPGEDRARTGSANWSQPLAWNRKAAATGTRPFVFCASLADVFDNEVPIAWRIELFDLIRSTPDLDWLLLTKRIGNAEKMLDEAGGWAGVFSGGGLRSTLPNVWLGATVANQEEAARDIPKLLATPAAVRFLSIEPMLGRIDLCETLGEEAEIHGALQPRRGVFPDGLVGFSCESVALALVVGLAGLQRGVGVYPAFLDGAGQDPLQCQAELLPGAWGFGDVTDEFGAIVHGEADQVTGADGGLGALENVLVEVDGFRGPVSAGHIFGTEYADGVGHGFGLAGHTCDEVIACAEQAVERSRGGECLGAVDAEPCFLSGDRVAVLVPVFARVEVRWPACPCL